MSGAPLSGVATADHLPPSHPVTSLPFFYTNLCMTLLCGLPLLFLPRCSSVFNILCPIYPPCLLCTKLHAWNNKSYLIKQPYKHMCFGHLTTRISWLWPLQTWCFKKLFSSPIIQVPCLSSIISDKMMRWWHLYPKKVKGCFYRDIQMFSKKTFLDILQKFFHDSVTKWDTVTIVHIWSDTDLVTLIFILLWLHSSSVLLGWICSFEADLKHCLLCLFPLAQLWLNMWIVFRFFY